MIKRQVANELSKSGLTEERRHQFSEKTRNDCEVRKIDQEDIAFVKTPKRDRKRIGSSYDNA